VGWEDSFRGGGGAGLKDDVGRQVGMEGGDEGNESEGEGVGNNSA